MYPKLSIILLTYNSNGMVHDAIVSLQNQTIKEMEIIIINDAPGDIIDDDIIINHMKDDERIIYIKNTSHYGTGYNRELGVRKATGEYIGFLDADDYALPEAYEQLYRLAKEENAEVVVANYQTFHERKFDMLIDSISKKNIIDSYHGNHFIISGKKLYSTQLKRIKMPYYLRVDWWNKIYKRSMLIDNGLTFPHVVRHEGFMSTIASLLAKKVVILDSICFLSYISKNSVSRKFKVSNITDIIISTLHIKNWLNKLGYYNMFKVDFINFSLYVLFNLNIKRIIESGCIEYFDILCKHILSNNDIVDMFTAYISSEKRQKEILIFSTLMNSRNNTILKLIQNTDFYYRTEYGKMNTLNRKNNHVITIVTVVRNIISRKKVFLQMVDSVHRQSIGYKNIEHIVVDGASDDGSIEFLENLVREKRISWVISEKDTGIYNAMNRGIDYSTGEFIIFLNSDDFFEDDMLKILLNVLIKEKSDYIFCNAKIVDDNNKRVGAHIGNINKVYFGTPYNHQALLCRQSCYEKVRYNEDFKLTMWPFAIDLYESGFKFSYINKGLVNFRRGGLSSDIEFVHEQNIIKRTISEKLHISLSEYEILNKFIRRQNLSTVNIGDVVQIIDRLDKKDHFSNIFYRNFYYLVQDLKSLNSLYADILKNIPTPINLS